MPHPPFGGSSPTQSLWPLTHSMSPSSYCRTSHFCSRSKSSISRCWLAPLWQCLALRWSRSSTGVITKEWATMSISDNGALMLTQLLPTSRTKGCSLNSLTKSWTLPIRNSSLRRLACLRWNWLSASKTSRPSGTTWIDPLIQMRHQCCLLS